MEVGQGVNRGELENDWSVPARKGYGEEFLGRIVGEFPYGASSDFAFDTPPRTFASFA